MFHALFSIASVLSLLVGAALTVAWARSYQVLDEVLLTRPGRQLWRLVSAQGRLRISVVENWPGRERVLASTPLPSKGVYVFFEAGPTVSHWQGVGLRAAYGEIHVLLDDDETIHQNLPHGEFDQAPLMMPYDLPFSAALPCRSLEVSHWLLLMVCGLPPLSSSWLSLRHTLLRRRRNALGLCEQCGYDLRASRCRCPECGTQIYVRKTAS
jgi:hypothetical protein